MTILRLGELTPDHIASWRDTGIVLLVGSWISTYSPVALPHGGAWSQGIWNLLFESWAGGRIAWLRDDFLHLPFEALMECYSDRAEVRSVLCSLYGQRSHNAVHERLISALVEGRIEGLITTNYDLGLDDCAAPHEEVSIIYDDATCGRHYANLAAGMRSLPYFKIHGTAVAGCEKELVCDLSSEGRLSGWKACLFRDLLKGRTLIVMGYSGRDFDICPELAWSTDQARTPWLEYRADLLQPMPRNVLMARDGMLVEGDLLDFMAVLFACRTDARPGRSDGRPELSFSEELRADWRVRLLNWLAAGDLGLTCVDDLVGTPEARSEMRAAMYGHIGRYHDAALTLESAARSPGLTQEASVRLQIGAAGSWFIYGHVLRGSWLLRNAKQKIWSGFRRNRELLARLHETEMMMYMRLAQIASQWSLRSLREYYRRRAKARYGKTRKYLEALGAHDRLQALQHNAERLGIAKLDGLALPIDPGYRNLGLASMAVIAQRDRLRATSDPWNASDVEIARACATRAEEYGWQHEAWKFSWLLFWHGDPIDRQSYWERFRQHFGMMQRYSRIGTLLQLRRNAGMIDTSTLRIRLSLWLHIVRAVI